MKVRFNPFGAEFRRDPYPQYRQLRENSPVHRTLGMWVLTRYADVQTVLRDRTVSAGLIPELVSKQAGRVSGGNVDRIRRLGHKSLVFTDNPDHARLRGLVNRVFTGPAVDALRPLVHDIADRLVEKACAEGEIDLIADFAAPLPVTVLCEWMALPASLCERVAGWTHDIRFLLEPGLMRGDDFTHVCEVVENFVAALEEVVEQRRSAPGEDLISRLLAVETGGGDRLSDEELIFVCIMCFVAGNETTKSLIGNMMLALLRNPGQFDLVRARPELTGATVDEALRYDCPLQLTKRLTTQELEVGGTRIPAGEQILLCMGAANRDAEVFERPDEFDVTRAAKGHLAFGYGMHGCLGGMLAELQARTALDCLLSRTESIEPRADDYEWQDHSFIVRGLRSLPVALRSAA